MKLADILFKENNKRLLVEVDITDWFDDLLQNEFVNIGERLLFRGSKDIVNVYRKIYVPESRPPRDTDSNVNEFIDNVRENDFEEGIISRKGQVVFATTNAMKARDYGTSYIVFIPKKYRAIYSEKDPTDSFFYEIYDAFAFITNLAIKLNKTNKHKLISLLAKYPKNLPKSLNECLDIMNKLHVLNEKLNDYGIDEIIDNFSYIVETAKEYFDQLYVAEAPWVEGYYETMIECEWYYLVEKQWFAENFVFDEEQNKYVRRKG